MDGKINGDNLDIYVKTNDIRMNNKNKDLHYFATDFTFDRVRLDHLEDTTAVGDPNNIDVQMFIPSSDEKTLYRNSLKYTKNTIFRNLFLWCIGSCSKFLLRVHIRIPYCFQIVAINNSNRILIELFTEFC